MDVHAEEVAREERRFLAARRRLDLHDGVARVRLVRRHEQHHQRLFRLGRGLFLFGEIVFDERAEFGIAFGFQQGAIILRGVQRPGPSVVRAEDAFQTPVLVREHGGAGGHGVDAGIRQLGFELAVPCLELFDLTCDVFRAHDAGLIKTIRKNKPGLRSTTRGPGWLIRRYA